MRTVCLMLTLVAAGSGWGQQAAAQDPAAEDAASESVVATRSNLTAALPADEWIKVEDSVDRGLAWLATQQQDDGRFPGPPTAQPAVTSMAVMAFLARGYVPDQGQYGAAISRAIEFVLTTQQRSGLLAERGLGGGGSGHLRPSQTAIYNHSVAGLMLGEVYGMGDAARSDRIEDALLQALVYHRRVQTREKAHPADHGGWRYGGPGGSSNDSDLSVTGWALMFLRSARNAEFDVPKLYFDQGLDFVQRCYEPNPDNHQDGVFRYRPPELQGNPQITLANTASATLTLILGGRDEHVGVRRSVVWFRGRPYAQPWQVPYFYLSTYYSSQAMAQVGGEAWTEVFPQIAAALLTEQTETGGWPAGLQREEALGDCYSTSLAVLALTPAYGLLPIYQR